MPPSAAESSGAGADGSVAKLRAHPFCCAVSAAPGLRGVHTPNTHEELSNGETSDGYRAEGE